jgi:hypothetical protein
MKSKIIKIGFLASFLIVQFFGVGFFYLVAPTQVFAQIVGNETNCKMNILSMEANPSTVDKNTKVNFHFKVQRNGCAENLDINFDFHINYSYNIIAKECIDKPPHNDIIENDCPYDFSLYPYWNDIKSTTQLPYYLRINSSQNTNYGDTNTWGKNFTASPQPLGQSFTFAVSPATAKIGDTINIFYQDFPPGAQGKIYVNDNNHFVNIYSGGNQIAVNSTNGFVANSPNNLRITLSDTTGKSIYDSTYTLNQPAASNPATTGNPPSANGATSGTSYGCVATNGIFTCATTQTDPGIAACANNGGIVSIPSANCGCAQTEVTSGVTGKNCKNNGGTGTVTPPAGGQPANSQTTLINPIPGYDNLTALVVNIMKGFLGIIAVWAVAFIVIGGFKMVISSGNEEAVLAAKKTITWAVLGLLIAVLSFAIIAIVQNLVGVKVPPPTSNTTGNPPSNTTGNPPSNTTGNPPSNTTGNPPN